MRWRAGDAAPIESPSRVPRAVLAALEPARQRNLLRHLLRRVQLGTPSAAKAEELRNALLDARAGRADATSSGPAARGGCFASICT